MKKLLPLSLLLLAACVSREGLSPESSKSPTGNPASSLIVEEFADLQCPACKGAHTTLVKPILEKYGQNIRYEFHHFPLRAIHAYAQEAAEAAECAADQGRFWEFVDDNYENQGALARADLLARAGKVGVADMKLFERCIKSRIKRDAVQAEYEDGVDRGVTGTPTFFIAGEKAPTNTLEALGTLIETKMNQQRL
jgi:protein-disulfide isomerase